MSEVVDLEVGRFALRTFRVSAEGEFDSLMYPEHRAWEGGVCEAKCLASGQHKAPSLGCSCGVYGALSYNCLLSQYPQAYMLTTVMAAEGTTVIGTRGLRSQYARIVAFYYNLNEWPIGRALRPRWVRKSCEKNFPDAKRYKNIRKMVEDHGLAWDLGEDSKSLSPASSNWWTS